MHIVSVWARLLSVPVLGSVLVIAGCGQPEVEFDTWQPLEAGWHWEYQRTDVLDGKRQVSRFVMDNLERRQIEELGDEYANQDLTVRRTSDGTDYYLYADQTGIYRAGTRNLIEYNPRADVEPRLIIPAADELDGGITWNQPSRPYMIHSTKSHLGWNAASMNLNLVWEVAERGETVTVAAGTFENCLRLEGRGTFGLYADPRTGYQEVPVVQTEWYAPGVGLIRLIRSEPLEMELFRGGEVLFELVSYHR